MHPTLKHDNLWWSVPFSHYMPVPSEIMALVEQLNRELDLIEEETTVGLNLVRPPLSIFPENARLIQFFAYLNNAQFFAQTYRRRIQTTVDAISTTEVSAEEIQEAAEDLGTILGVVLEVRIEVEQIINRLEELQ